MLCLSSSKPSAYYKNELNAIKKSGAQLQPVYEAFSNAWKSIEERFHGELMRHGRIRMEFHYTMGLFKNDAENRGSYNIVVFLTICISYANNCFTL